VLSTSTHAIDQSVWPHNVPALAFGLTYVLSVVLCFAVGIMLLYHLWTVSVGETSVEGLDHNVYRKVAKSRGEVRLPKSCLFGGLEPS
jgi:palmitoyltransferase